MFSLPLKFEDFTFKNYFLRSTGIKGAKRSPQKDQPVVIRRSLRTRGLPPTLASGVDGDRSTTSTEIIGRPQPEASHPPSPKLTSGPINLLEEDSNAKLLLELLQRTECSSNDITSDVEVKDNEFALFKDLKQVEKDVAKVVKDRVYFAEFLPLRYADISFFLLEGVVGFGGVGGVFFHVKSVIFPGTSTSWL